MCVFSFSHETKLESPDSKKERKKLKVYIELVWGSWLLSLLLKRLQIYRWCMLNPHFYTIKLHLGGVVCHSIHVRVRGRLPAHSLCHFVLLNSVHRLCCKCLHLLSYLYDHWILGSGTFLASATQTPAVFCPFLNQKVRQTTYYNCTTVHIISLWLEDMTIFKNENVQKM